VLLNSDSVKSGKWHWWPTASGRSHHLATVRRRGGRASVRERLMSTWTPAPSPFLLHLSSSTAARPSLPPSLPSVSTNSGDAPRCNHHTIALATLCTASPPPLLHRTPTGLPNRGTAWSYFEFLPPVPPSAVTLAGPRGWLISVLHFSLPRLSLVSHITLKLTRSYSQSLSRRIRRNAFASPPPPPLPPTGTS
jgi:hypothetical protein